MRNILLILAFLIGGFDAYGAVTARGRGNPSTSAATTQQSGGKSSPTGTATGARGARVASQPPTSAKNVSVRGARSAATPVSSANTKVIGRAATTPATSKVQARAAKQGVISNGTKIATANQNSAVDEECWDKFSGCMDAFCMVENANGGRCICSDKNAEYDSILAEIQNLDNQSYQMATVGVERIEMGDDADAIMAKTKQITNSIEKDSQNTKSSKRKSLDLSSWNSAEMGFEDEIEDMFALSADGNSIANKTGDALYRASAQLCTSQIPECKNDAKMMQLMYQQRIRSDCSAYENSLRQQRTQSAQKLAAAQSAMREAALEQYRNANKYDLGQCTIEFKKCMQTTAGCGDDFTGCVTQQTTRDTLLSEKEGGNTKSPKKKQIKGASTTIEIAAWTYDALDAKKPLCMTVTQQCVNVKNQVWDTFLREVAPQLKSAELAAESNLRTSCISTISDCFQKACKDNIDPNNPDGSYDMCLTRPETLRNFCKVQIDPCEAAEPKIMDYVRARLASMRVDSCTTQFKDCLQSEDRCGSDYTQCIGLDTDTIVRLCPAEKLVGCQYEDEDKSSDIARPAGKTKVRNEEEIYEELARITQGIFLNIDNNLLSSCKKAVQEKVLEICGSLSDCNAFEDDDIIGTDSLITYREGDKIIIDGLMNFGLLTSKETTIKGKKSYIIDSSKIYLGPTDVDSNTRERIKSAIQTVENRVTQKLAALSADPTIDMCINGRSNNWRYSKTEKKDQQTDDFKRFPNLLDSYAKMIFNSGLAKAYLNYHTKYDEMVGKAIEDQSDDIKTAMCAAIAHQEGAPICDSYKDTDDGSAVCEHYKAATQLESIFGDGAGDTGLKNHGTRYVILGADLKKKLNAAAQGKGEFIQTDKNGSMIGSISITTNYSPGTNICTVTTTSTICSDVKTIITTDTDDCGGGGIVGIGGGCGQGGIQILGGYGHTTTTEHYNGTYCSSYADPVTDTREIKM